MNDTAKRDAWIVDIDGTLAHTEGRRSPYNEALVSLDSPDPVVIELVQLLAPRYDILICSGRHDTCRTDTVAWLQQHNVPYTNLFMRGAEDNRKDSIIKLEILDNYILPTWNVVGVLDDRNQVVEAWRSRGLKCLQVEPGDF